MPLVTEVLRSLRAFRHGPLPPEGFASFDPQWVLPKGTWEEGARLFASLFPRATRLERPSAWYAQMTYTHIPGRAPPGNGPFYWPAWALPSDPTEAGAVEAVLKRAGFRHMNVPTAPIPPTSEWLAGARKRIPADGAWNVHPVLYEVYWYPALSSKARTVRTRTTPRIPR
jgi:hypothetical protein